MHITMNTGGIAQTNAFLLADERTKQAVLFDAPNDTAGTLLDQVQRRGWELMGLWLTHGHFDHLADHALVRQRFPKARILIHRLDEPKLRQPNSALFPLPFVIPPGQPDGYVEDGQKLKLGDSTVEVIHTPGHSPGHVAYYLPAEKALVGGDLIIAGSVGRTDLPDSDPAQLEASIRRIMRLPDDTGLLPGHGQPSTLAHERQTNPFVQSALEAHGQ